MEKESLKESYVTPEITIEEILPIARTCGTGGCGCGSVSCGVSCGGYGSSEL